MIVLSETTDMKVIWSDARATAKPDVNFFQKQGADWALLHLTRGSAPLLHGNTQQSNAAAAIEFNGAVSVQLESGESGNADWEFHFIQYIMEPVARATYAAPNPVGGSLVLDLTEKNIQFRLDSRTSSAPYPDQKVAQSATGPGGSSQRRNGFVDHPNDAFPMVWENYLTGANVFLVRLQKQIYFHTAFVAKDKLNRRSTDYIPLANVIWNAAWDFGIAWSKDETDAFQPAPYGLFSTFGVGDVSKTYPPRELAKMFESPTTQASEMYGDIHAGFMAAALGANADNANCHAFRWWPSDFTPQFS